MVKSHEIEELAKLIAEGVTEGNAKALQPKLIESAKLVLMGSDLSEMRRLCAEHDAFLRVIPSLSAREQRDLLRRWNPHRRPSADEGSTKGFDVELRKLASGVLEPTEKPKTEEYDTRESG